MREKITAWVARDEDESLNLFLEEPSYDGTYWTDEINFCGFPLNEKNLFPSVKWEDEKATEVELYIDDKASNGDLTVWVARDEDDYIFLHASKPIKSIEYGCFAEHNCNLVVGINKELFPFVKWEDKEPTEVEITIRKK